MYKLNRAFELCGRLQGLYAKSANASEASLTASLQTRQTVIRVPTCSSEANNMNMVAQPGVLQDPQQQIFTSFPDSFALPTSMEMDFFPAMNTHGPT